MFYITKSTASGNSETVAYDIAQPGRAGERYLRARTINGIVMVPLSEVCELDAYGDIKLDSAGNPIIKPGANPRHINAKTDLKNFLLGSRIPRRRVYVNYHGTDVSISQTFYQAVNTDARNRERYYTDNEGKFIETKKVMPPAYRRMNPDEKLGDGSTKLIKALFSGEREYAFCSVTSPSGEEYFRSEKFKCENGEILKGDSSDKVGKVKQDVKVKLSGDIVTVSASGGTNVYVVDTPKGRLTLESSLDDIKITRNGKRYNFSKISSSNSVEVQDFNINLTPGVGGASSKIEVTIDVNDDINYANMSPADRGKFIFDRHNNEVIKLKTNAGNEISASDLGLESLSDIKIEDVVFYKESQIFKYDVDGKIERDPTTHEPILQADIIQISKEKTDNSVEKVAKLRPDSAIILNAINEILRLKGEIESLSTADPDFISKANDAIKEIEKHYNILKENMQSDEFAKLKDVIDIFRDGDCFKTFYFDERGIKKNIDANEKVEISSTPPFDFLGNDVYKKIIGNNKIENVKGKIKVRTNTKVDNLVGDMLDIAGSMAQLAFGSGILALPFCALLFAPMTLLTVGAGVIKVGAVVQAKIKQVKITHLTPQKIKNREIKATEKYIKTEIKKAEKTYREEMKSAKKRLTGSSLITEQQNISKKFVERKAEIKEACMLFESGTVNSKFDSKTKEVKPENLYGFAGYISAKKLAKKGIPLDFDAKEKIEQAKEEFNRKTGKNIFKKIFAKKADKVERDRPKHEFLAEHGPVAKRISHLKKTKAYYVATKEQRKAMIQDKKDKNEAVVQKTSVSSVDVLGRGDKRGRVNRLEKITKKFMERHTPKELKGKSFTKKQMIEHNKEKVVVQSRDEKYLDESNKPLIDASAIADLSLAKSTVRVVETLKDKLTEIDADASVTDKETAKKIAIDEVRTRWSTTAATAIPTPTTSISPSTAISATSTPATSASPSTAPSVTPTNPKTISTKKAGTNPKTSGTATKGTTNISGQTSKNIGKTKPANKGTVPLPNTGHRTTNSVSKPSKKVGTQASTKTAGTNKRGTTNMPGQSRQNIAKTDTRGNIYNPKKSGARRNASYTKMDGSVDSSRMPTDAGLTT